MMKTGLLAVVASALISVSAFAGEYANEGVYAGVLGGVNFQNYRKHHVDLDMNTGYMVGGFAGYKFSSSLRLEAELAFRRNSVENFKYQEQLFDAHGHTDTRSIMANVLYDFDFNPMWTPYVGLGGGYAYTKARMNDHAVDLTAKDDGFVWQAIAGLAYRVSCDTDLGLEYRFFPARERANDHTVALSLKRYF